MVSPGIFFLTLTACLERITGEDVPLDPRFYASAISEASSVHGAGDNPQPGLGVPGDGMGGEAPPHSAGEPGQPPPSGEAPWASYTGDTVVVTGTVVLAENQTVEAGKPISIDVCVPDASSPGGQSRVGRLYLSDVGTFELKVPTDVTSLKLEAFQDISSDGPDVSDPYAEANITLPATEPIALSLEVGARGRAPGGGDPNAGNPNAGNPTDPPPMGVPENVPPPEGLYFPNVSAWVKLSGKLTGTLPEGKRILDVFQPGTSGAARTFLGKVPLTSDTFTLELPKDYGLVEIEAYIDLTGDGRSGDDVAVTCSCNPVKVESVDISGIEVAF